MVQSIRGAADQAKIRVLLAEDEEHVAKLIVFKLTREGFEVTRVHDGGAVLDRLAHSPQPDLLILDVMMPVHDGWEVLRHVRATPALERLPVIVLSARTLRKEHKEHKEQMSAIGVGPTRFLRKPFEPGELATLARRMVNEPDGEEGT